MIKHYKNFWRDFQITAIGFIVVFVMVSTAWANVTINLVVMNGSADETKKTPLKYYLPKELEPEDIINSAGLKIDYDINKSSYYVYGETELGPKESKTIKIEVKDVWRIAQQEIDILRKQIDDNLALLVKTNYYQTAQVLRDDAFSKLDYIVAQQKNYSDNTERRMEEYRAHVSVLDEIRKNAFSTDYLKSVPDVEVKGTIKLIIEVKNPSETEEKKTKQKHYLPQEIRSEHIVDPKGFEIRYDDEKQRSYLAKEETLKPGETKRYEIIIRDIWHIAQEKVDLLRERSQRALEGVKDSEYAQSAEFLVEGITENLNEIEKSQKEKKDMEKYIGAFRTNKKRFAKAEDDIAKLEKMLAAVKAKKLEELESSKVKNVLQKLKALRGVMAISQAIFGKKPTMTTTWRVIWGILIFIAFFTALHFFTWWKKSQVMGEDIAVKAGGTIKPITEAKEKAEEAEKKR